MTFVLIMSSVTMVLAVEAGHRMDKAAVEKWMLWTILGGITFLSCQAWEWAHFIHGTYSGSLLADGTKIFGASLSSNQYGPPDFAGFFFFITGFHGFHVFSGVLLNFLIFYNTVTGVYERRGHYEMVEKVGFVEPSVNFGSETKRVAVGTVVHLTGTGLASDATVFVDGLPANVRSVGANGTSLDFDAPDAEIGTTADLAVVNGDGQGFAVEDALFYAPAPEISSVTDTSGNALLGSGTAGTVTVHIVGSGFSSQTLVDFGATRGTQLAVLSDTRLQVRLPQQNPGTVIVSVVDEFGRRSVTPVNFEFKARAGPSKRRLNAGRIGCPTAQARSSARMDRPRMPTAAANRD
jgi:hypothetical protein